MKTRLSLVLLLVALLLAPLNLAARGADLPWEPVVPGIDYVELHLTNPKNNAYVARMDRSNSSVTLESAIGQGHLWSGTESVSGMAARYDDALNNWGAAWGSRNKVVAAINGYFFDGSTGMPWRGQVQSGWYAKRFDDGENGSGFGWKLDRSAFIGGCVGHPADKQRVTFQDGSTYMTISGINTDRGDDQLIIYTPQYDRDTHTADTPEGGKPPDLSGSVEVLVELSRPMLISPVTDNTIGVIREIRPEQGSTPIPFDHVVLSASGDAGAALFSNARVGEQIGISQVVKECGSNDTSLWAHTYASLGGSFDFLRNGEIQAFTDAGANVRNPRTAIAYNDQYVYFIVVDGRDAANSVGMTMAELGAFSRDTLGAVWGINQDGGGSSTMVVNGEVKNNTYCNNNPCGYKAFLPLVFHNPAERLISWRWATEGYTPRPWMRAQAGEIPPTGGNPLIPGSPEAYQRPVANGMLMVVVEPVKKSTEYTPGTAVRLTEEANLRLGPGTNYASLGLLPAGSEGAVLAHANGLDGVWAKGYYWWKVDFGGWKVGWAAEEFLSRK